MDLGLLARALKTQVDLAAGNTTDGLITALDLFVLEDDRRYFPPYEAVPMIGRRCWRAIRRWKSAGRTCGKDFR